MNQVNFILGTMTFGEQLFGDDVTEMIRSFAACGYTELDTAYVYNNGQSEALIGEALQKIGQSDIKVSTKVNPRITGRLDKAAVYSQFEESLKRLQLDCVDTLYLHFPDASVPVESPLEACADLFAQGKFKRLGLSNFPAWLVVDVYYKCKENGWMLPSVYEGLYNPLSRKAEGELKQVLDAFGLSFCAYNPLAGGMLTNKYSGMSDAPTDGRFINRPNYKNRYWKQSYFDAIDVLKKLCEAHGISIIEATYRWMAYHSMLNMSRGDAIIIGVSKISQLSQNIAAVENGKLPDEIVEAFENAWETTKADAPEYFRFYNS